MGKVNLALNAKRCTFIAGDYRLGGLSPMANQSRAQNPLAAKLHRANSSMLSPNRPLEPARVAVVIPRHPAGILLPVVWRKQDEARAFKRSLPDATFRCRLAGRYPPGATPDATNPYISRRLIQYTRTQQPVQLHPQESSLS